VIELNYAGFVIDLYLCELVFVNHVNICGRVHELTPKNGTNLSNFELTKEAPRLNQISAPQPGAVLVLALAWRDYCPPYALRQYWCWLCAGATTS
jgi:hypothetical protein